MSNTAGSIEVNKMFGSVLSSAFTRLFRTVKAA